MCSLSVTTHNLTGLSYLHTTIRFQKCTGAQCPWPGYSTQSIYQFLLRQCVFDLVSSLKPHPTAVLKENGGASWQLKISKPSPKAAKTKSSRSGKSSSNYSKGTIDAKDFPAEEYEPNSGCWLWEAGVDNKGYGRITVSNKKKMELAHRVSWMLHNNQVPSGFVLHRCDNTYCVNPDHLYVGTQKDNMLDRSQRGRMPDQRGEKSHRAKLTASQILAIRSDPRAQSLIAADYGVSPSAISLIKLRKKWSHI